MNGPRRFATLGGKLKDDRIIDGLHEAIDSYKNGEIWETQEVCRGIAEAIQWYDEACQRHGGPI